MFNGKLSTFNMLTIPFLLISAASSTPLRACSSTNARSLGSFQESSIQVRDDGPFCHPQPPGRCTLSITAGQPREWAAVANYACVPIGGWLMGTALLTRIPVSAMLENVMDLTTLVGMFNTKTTNTTTTPFITASSLAHKAR
ncbi:hypothetical protein ACMFMF_004462 [Clarireedia jacksonii]